MKEIIEQIGKVRPTTDGDHSIDKQYDILSIVYDTLSNKSYISRKDVPKGILLTNKEYWQLFGNNRIDNDSIILLSEIVDGAAEAYTLQEAIDKIILENRRVGAFISFYEKPNDLIDTYHWNLYQFNSNDIKHWNDSTAWSSVYYNKTKFYGLLPNEETLYKVKKNPAIGDYAFIGTSLGEAIVAVCYNKGVWKLTAELATNYLTIIVKGNVTVGPNGNWFNDGIDTGIPAKGEKGDKPYFRYNNITNYIEYSFDQKNWNNLIDKEEITGAAATIKIGNIVTVQPSSLAKVTNSGNIHDAILNFEIPKGETGNRGEKGETGNGLLISGYKDNIDSLPVAEDIGEAWLVGTNIPYNLYIWDGSQWKDNGPINQTQIVLNDNFGNSSTSAMTQRTVTKNIGFDEYELFSPTQNYVIGDIVNYLGNIKIFTINHPAGDWIGTDVTDYSLKAEIDKNINKLKLEKNYNILLNKNINDIEINITNKKIQNIWLFKGLILEGQFININLKSDKVIRYSTIYREVEDGDIQYAYDYEPNIEQKVSFNKNIIEFGIYVETDNIADVGISTLDISFDFSSYDKISSIESNINILQLNNNDFQELYLKDGIQKNIIVKDKSIKIWMAEDEFIEGTEFIAKCNLNDVISQYSTIYVDENDLEGYAYDFTDNDEHKFTYNKNIKKVGLFIDKLNILKEGEIKTYFKIPSISVYDNIEKTIYAKDSLPTYYENLDSYIFINKEDIRYGAINSTTGIAADGNTKNNVYTKFYPVPSNLILRPFEKSNEYKYYCAIYCYDADKTFIGAINNKGYQRFKTNQKLLDGTCYIRFVITNDLVNGGQVEININNYQLGYPIGDGIINRNFSHDTNLNLIINNNNIIKSLINRCKSLFNINMYTNPLYDKNMPDVSIWDGEDGFYYCIGTNSITNFPIIRSRDLINWEFYNNNLIDENALNQIVLNNPEDTIFYAPHMKKIGNYWNLYITISYKKMIVLTSDNPISGFKFYNNEYYILLDDTITNLGATYEDAFCFIENNIPYLFWGSAGKLYAVKLNNDGYTLFDNNYIRVINGASRGALHEGTYIVKRDNYYYYFGSGGYYADDTYKITVGRSENLLGPYYDKEGNEIDGDNATIILKSDRYDIFYGVGHNGEIIEDADGNIYMFLHAYDLNKDYGARYLCLQEIEWQNGFPTVYGNKLNNNGITPKLPIKFL